MDVNISKRNLMGIIILIIVGTVLFVVTSSKDYQNALYQTQQEINAPAQQKFMQDIHNNFNWPCVVLPVRCPAVIRNMEI